MSFIPSNEIIFYMAIRAFSTPPSFWMSFAGESCPSPSQSLDSQAWRCWPVLSYLETTVFISCLQKGSIIYHCCLTKAWVIHWNGIAILMYIAMMPKVCIQNLCFHLQVDVVQNSFQPTSHLLVCRFLIKRISKTWSTWRLWFIYCIFVPFLYLAVTRNCF